MAKLIKLNLEDHIKYTPLPSGWSDIGKFAGTAVLSFSTLAGSSSISACADGGRGPLAPTPDDGGGGGNPPPQEQYASLNDSIVGLISGQNVSSATITLRQAGPNGQDVVLEATNGRYSLTPEHKVKPGIYTAIVEPRDGSYPRQTPLVIEANRSYVDTKDGMQHQGLNLIEPDNVSNFNTFAQWGLYPNNGRFTQNPDVLVYDKSVYAVSNEGRTYTKVADADMDPITKNALLTMKSRRDLEAMTNGLYPGNWRFESEVGSLPAPSYPDISNVIFYIPVNNTGPGNWIALKGSPSNNIALLMLNTNANAPVSLWPLMVDTFEGFGYLNNAGTVGVNTDGTLNQIGRNMSKIKYSRPPTLVAPDITP